MEEHSFIKFVPGVYVVYLSVPKVASSSISHSMMLKCPTSSPDIEEHSPVGKALTSRRPVTAPHPDLPIFTFTRHPIKKFLSYYADKFVNARKSGFELNHLGQLGFSPDMTLDDVVRHMMSIPVRKMEHHAQPQNRIIIKNKKIIADFVGKVEEIDETWPVVEKVSLTDFNIPLNKNQSSSKKYESIISEYALEGLTKYYAEDFEILGYEKPEVPDKHFPSVASGWHLSSSDLYRLKSELDERNRRFVNLSKRLDDPGFRSRYMDDVVSRYNDYYIYSNRALKEKSRKQRLKNKISNFSQSLNPVSWMGRRIRHDNRDIFY